MEKQIRSGKFDFNHPDFDKISFNLKDLIMKLLKVDIDERISAKDALSHPWFNDYEKNLNNTNKIDD